jgi:hypothetical protein
MDGRSWRIWAVAAAAVVVLAAVLAVPFVVDRSGEAPSAAGTETAGPAPVPPPPPDAPMRRLAPPADGVYLGVSNAALPREPGAIRRWSATHGVRPRIVNWFQQWLSGERAFRADWAARVARQGAVPMITWEPWYAPAGERHTEVQPDVSLARIADGDHDRYVRSFARQVAAYKGPVLIRLMHEMNGFWYPWGVRVNGNRPADYIRAWRHVHRVFEQAGARNVSWIWSINNLEWPDGEGRDIHNYYPGARYVDWVSTSGFNWGSAYEWSGWRTADPLYRDTYRALSRFAKPIMISEIGTTSLGGDPEEWIVTTLARLRTAYPRLRAVVWYDDVDAAGLDFRLRGPTERTVSRPEAVGRGWLRAPRIVALAPD